MVTLQHTIYMYTEKTSKGKKHFVIWGHEFIIIDLRKNMKLKLVRFFQGKT